MTEDDLAARLREGLRQRQNDGLFLPVGEGPLSKPEPWKPDPEPKRTCSTGKARFSRPSHARGWLEQLHRRVEQGDTSRDYIPLYIAPRCKKCKGWHVTSKIPKQHRNDPRRSPRPQKD